MTAGMVNPMVRREIPPMQYRSLGRTGLRVSILSLGSGGPNRFGQKRYIPRPHIIDLVCFALEMGINFFDTASAYGESEAILGEALRKIPRDRFVIATKFSPVSGGRISSPESVIKTVERSLKKLRVQTIDLLQFHIVTPDMYRGITESLMPVVDNLRNEGKFRFLGITESTSRDRDHEMLGMALEDNIFDTIMVAYGPSNTAAEGNILHTAGEKGVGVICTASARETARLRRASGNIIPGSDRRNGEMFRSHHARGKGGSLTNRPEHPGPAFAYAYSISHPAVSTVLTGTVDREHLAENALALLGGPRFSRI